MTWLTPKLDKRIDICIPIQDPEGHGGFDITYDTILSVWCNIKPISEGSYIRGQQIESKITHVIIIRNIALKELELRTGTNTINPIKSNYFIFLRQGEEEASKRGRRFQVKNMIRADEKDEYYKILVEELFEEGTGY